MTALLLLKYSVLLATISQRVKARRASKKEGKCDNEINPSPAGPLRARQAEHDVPQPPCPQGTAGEAGRAATPEMPLYCPILPHPWCHLQNAAKGQQELGRVPPGGLSVPWAPSSPPGRGCSSPCSKPGAKSELCWLEIPPGLGDIAESPQRFCTPRYGGSQALHSHSLVLMMERQIYNAKEQPLEPRGDCGRGFSNPAIGPELALQWLAHLPRFSKKSFGAGRGKMKRSKWSVPPVQGGMVEGVHAPARSPGWMGDAATGRRVCARRSSRSRMVSGGWRPPATVPRMGRAPWSWATQHGQLGRGLVLHLLHLPWLLGPIP